MKTIEKIKNHVGVVRHIAGDYLRSNPPVEIVLADDIDTLLSELARRDRAIEWLAERMGR